MNRIVIFLLMLFATGLVYNQEVQSLTSYVDPFIGTKGEGHTFPGTSVPFGMVKLGPDCGDKRSNSGYIPDAQIHGFSHTHVSGTGGGAKYGNILVMPFTGKISPGSISSKPKNYNASPAYFAVDLDRYKIKAELTSSHSVGFHKYTFNQNNDKGILIDSGSFLGAGHCCGEAQELIGSETRIISENRIEGYSRVRGGWNKGGEYTVFFVALFDTPADSYGTWKNDEIMSGSKMAHDSGDKTGAYFLFNNKTDNIINVKVGISFISTGKAYDNITKETKGWDFEQAHKTAVNKWNDALKTIQIESANDDLKKVFYTAMYHTMLMPTDRTGENPKWNSGEPYYDDFYAIWDTYRATNPLLTLIQPKREAAIVRSLIDIYNYEGYMPDSRSGNYTGRTQGGSNCDMVIAEAYLKGLKGIDFEKGYEAMIKNAEIPPGDNQQREGRGGINEYIDLGYVPTEYEPESGAPDLHIPKLYARAGTRTLEYAANDWAIALVAKGMGKSKDYLKYKKRASNWSHLWNTNIKAEGVSGFIWPKTKNGRWVEDYSVNKGGSWSNFFYEANSWEYSFYVPQDVQSLIDSCGGNDSFISRLDTFFKNQHFNVSNEPSFFTPCLYTYAGKQDKTNITIRNIIKEGYTAEQNGIPGNDDAGSMSAWVVFNLMGFFPNAGQDVYIITSPHFKQISIDLDEGKRLKIIAHDLSEENIYIKNVLLNGKPLNKAWFRHNEIKEGGKLEYFMNSNPTNSWEIEPPPSIADYD